MHANRETNVTAPGDALAAGKAALDAGDLHAALAHFEAVVADLPDGTAGWGNLAAVYAAVGAADRAEACYDHILAQAPDHADARYNRGVVRLQGGRFDAAHDDFAAVTHLLPDDADARNNLAVTAFMRGHLDEAGRELRRVLARRPDHADAVLNLCDVEIADGRPDAAVAACDAFLAGYDHPEVARRCFDLKAEATRRALAGARDLMAAAATS